MSKPPSPASIPPTGNVPETAPTLFDPYLSAGQTWHAKAINQNDPQLWVIPPAEALEHLEKLAKQFQQPSDGWKALLLAPPGWQAESWATPAKLTQLQGLLPELLGTAQGQAFHQFCYLLPDNRLALVLHHPESGTLVPLVYRLAALLVGPELAPRTAVTLLDLARDYAKLGLLPAQIQQTLANRANAQESAQQAAHRQQLQQSLNPAALAPAIARRVSRRKPEVLIVEDDPSTAMLLEMLLEGLITTASSGTALLAAQTYEIHAPDLVLLDLGLPDLGGLALLELIRAADPAAKVVILTATATKTNLEAARQLGAVGFMAKPFTRAKLQETLQQHGLIKVR